MYALAFLLHTARAWFCIVLYKTLAVVYERVAYLDAYLLCTYTRVVVRFDFVKDVCAAGYCRFSTTYVNFVFQRICCFRTFPIFVNGYMSLRESFSRNQLLLRWLRFRFDSRRTRVFCSLNYIVLFIILAYGGFLFMPRRCVAVLIYQPTFTARCVRTQKHYAVAVKV